MPELPEVETVRLGLEILLPNQPRIARVELIRGDLRNSITAESLAVLANQPITAVRRRAKYLLLETPKFILLSHLGMTGSWRVAALGEEKKHDHCYLHLEDGRRLAFHDPRRFGLLAVVVRGLEEQHKAMMGLGPEPLDPKAFHADWVFEKTRRRQTAIKVWLMDQRHVVGVGNIYASEALYLAKIKPQRLAHKISRSDSARLVKAVQTVLNRAILHGGTTLRDYRQAGGGSGGFQFRLSVYDRGDKPCRRCRGKIRRAVLGGRSTYWCPTCQK